MLIFTQGGGEGRGGEGRGGEGRGGEGRGGEGRGGEGRGGEGRGGEGRGGEGREGKRGRGGREYRKFQVHCPKIATRIRACAHFWCNLEFKILCMRGFSSRFLDNGPDTVAASPNCGGCGLGIQNHDNHLNPNH